MEIYAEIETIESFIKSEYTDGKMNEEVARELLRMTMELKDKVLNQ
ncbi:hypothetical protein GCM10011418_38990 [Sphingobacterium alkalisoli]|nr:hypothetical protein [Sphingobacterium alkalisoli]GGH28375.1 hypothetical protein GCM10011418_38990 [Sphingobacterium alkalisoli]